MMTTGGHLQPCETKWYFVENENKKIVIDNSANRPRKRDGKELGDVLNRDFPFKKWQERRAIEGNLRETRFIIKTKTDLIW